MSQDEKAVNDEVVAQETTATESAPVENNTPEVADPLLEILSSDNDDDVVQKSETDSPETQDESIIENPEESPADETKTEEQPLDEDKQLSPKAENRFQKLANENKEMREYIEKLNAETYKPQTAEELVDEGLSPELAEVRSLKQELELQAYNNRVIEAQTSLSKEAEQVIKDFPLFDSESPEFDKDIAQAASESLAASLIKDPNTGQIIGSHLTPYQIYKPIADAYMKSRIAGQIRGQKATEQMLASVDATPSATPKEPKKDPLLEILSSDD